MGKIGVIQRTATLKAWLRQINRDARDKGRVVKQSYDKTIFLNKKMYD